MLANRDPVTTLWTAVVAERLGYDRAEALSLARGRRDSGSTSSHHTRSAAGGTRGKPDERLLVEVRGRVVPAVATDGGALVPGWTELRVEE